MPSQRSYWRFYWPLSLITIAILIGRFAQNYVLLVFPNGVRELAVYALALAAFTPFRAPLIFVPQMANVLVRGPRSLRATMLSVVLVALALTLPVSLAGWTPLGPAVLRRLYDVDASRVRQMVVYMRYFTPLPLLVAAGGYCFGLLVQARRTGVVTLLRVLGLVLTVAVLAVGIRLRWPPTATLGLSLLLPMAAHAGVAALCVIRLHHHAHPEQDEALSQRAVAAFFLPLVFTPVMFALTRPILFRFVTALDPQGTPGLPPVDAIVSALSLAFAFAMIFQGLVNQFRHVMVTFAGEDLPGVRRFMLRVTAADVALMLAVLMTPLTRLFMSELQGAEGETLRMAVEAVWPLLLCPVCIAWRNYYHGLAMVHRRTMAMAGGSVMRNAVVLIAAPVLMRFGAFNHVTAAAMLPLAFGAEAATVMLWSRTWRRATAVG